MNRLKLFNSVQTPPAEVYISTYTMTKLKRKNNRQHKMAKRRKKRALPKEIRLPFGKPIRTYIRFQVTPQYD